MTISSGDGSENLTAYRLRWLGYGFLVFALIDAIFTVLTAQPGQPTWLLQVIGQFVEKSVVPLLGFTLVFFGEYFGRRDSEKLGLRLLSWLCLLLAIVFFLMAPSAVVQGFMQRGELDRQASVAVQQGTQAVEKQLSDLKNLEAQIDKATPAQITALANQLSAQGVPIDPSKPEQVKTQIRERVKTLQGNLETQKNQGVERVQQQASSQASNVLKNAVKWGVGAIIAGILFLYLWLSSKWAR